MDANDVELESQDMAELPEHQLAALAALEVTAHQEDLGGSFQGSVTEWQAAKSDDFLSLCFLHRQLPVGMVLLKRPPLSPPWVPVSAVSLHGLKIEQANQGLGLGLGLGKYAFKLAVANARDKWPATKSLILAVDAGNDPALAVYRGFGMSDSGPVHQSRIGWEHRLEVPLQV